MVNCGGGFHFCFQIEPLKKRKCTLKPPDFTYDLDGQIKILEDTEFDTRFTKKIKLLDKNMEFDTTSPQKIHYSSSNKDISSVSN